MRVDHVKAFARSPVILLMACGLLFSARIMISKVSLTAGAQPLQIAFISNLGAGLLLYGITKSRGIEIPNAKRHIILYLVLGFVSVCLPNALQQFVVLHVGPAYTSTVFALSPVITLVIATVIGQERLILKRAVGIAAGLCGMLALLQQQISQTDYSQYVWVIVGLGIPVCAALGNIIRSAYWPSGMSALAFSCATVSTSASFLLVFMLVFETESIHSLSGSSTIGPLTLLIVVSTASYLMNFKLQEVGGAVFFSQLGYWGTGFGVILAALLFGDVLSAFSLIALAAIAVGGVLVKGKPSVNILSTRPRPKLG
jgi:drug/metabolite transporter (DMT)-like permease